MKKIYEEIDLLKGIGIICMILGHVLIGESTEKYIAAFNMPLFFIVSGFLYSNTNIDFKTFAKKRFNRLIVPYIFFGLFHFIIKVPFMIIQKQSITASIYHLFLYNNDGLPICGALWFLTALFFVYIIYYLVDKMNKKYIKNITLILIVLLGYFITQKTRLPWCLDISMICVGFFHLGYLFRKYIEKNEKTSYWAIILLIIGSLLSFINVRVNLREAIFGNFIIFYSCAFMMTIGLFGICQRIKEKKLSLINEIKYIGKNSLLYMLFNQIIVWLPNIIISHIDGIAISKIIKVLVVLITLVIIHGVCLLFNRNEKLKRLIGG